MQLCRAAQKEIDTLSHIAGHLNTKLHTADNKAPGESVDLDNLFAFLSDVQTGRMSNHIIDEIGERMKELVTDLDVEVHNAVSCNKTI